MAAVEWIKLDVGLFSNRKIRQILALKKGDTLLVIWLKLLILAANSECGELSIAKGMPYAAETLATEINKPLKDVRQALDTFKCFDMIEDISGVLFIKNWEKYQNVDGMEKAREQTRVRNIAYRERKRNKAANVTHDVTHDVTVTRYDATDKEEDKEEDKNNNGGGIEIDKEIDKNNGGSTAADALIAYAANNLQYMSKANVDELASFRDCLTDDMIQWAIDESCANGTRKYAYCRKILNRMVEKGFKTLGDVKAAEAQRRKGADKTEDEGRSDVWAERLKGTVVL